MRRRRQRALAGAGGACTTRSLFWWGVGASVLANVLTGLTVVIVQRIRGKV